jgi:hypothetical protein
MADDLEFQVFRRVVALNEGAKLVLRRGFEVNLRALDATVQSRQQAGALRGFDEVASQIRGWSRELCAQIETLSALSRQAVELTSEFVKSTRQARLVRAATQSSSDESLRKVMSEVEERVQSSDSRIREQWRKIRAELGDLNQLGMMATVLARGAMLESVYAAAPEQRERLMQVSKEFYENAEGVSDTLRALLRDT